MPIGTAGLTAVQRSQKIQSNITAGAGITGGLFQVAGAIQEGQSIADAEDFNATIAQQEILISKATRQLERGREKEDIARFIGTQQALFAKSGVTLEGSPLDVIQQSAENLELDVLIGDINARIRESGLASEVSQRKIAARAAKSRGVSRAGATLLSTVEKTSKLFAKK